MGAGDGSTDAFRRDYLPYGEALTEVGSDEDMPYQFTGKELDNNAAELYYFGARYYMPGIGRWLAPDPLAGKYPDTTPYHYTHNNPTNRIDIDGRQDAYANHMKAMAAAARRGDQSAKDGLVFQAAAGQSMASSIANSGEGILAALASPVETLSTIGDALANPIETLGAISDGISQAIGNFVSDDPQVAGAAAGQTIAVGIELAVGGKGASSLKVSKTSATAGKGLITPKKYFGNITKAQAEVALGNKFGPAKSSRATAKTFFNEKTKRSFNVHQEAGHQGGKPHVDIRKRGPQKEKKYNLKDE